MDKGEQEYTTRSMTEAAYLYLNGAQLVSAIDSRRCEEFTFGNKDDCARHLAEQFYEDATVPARTYGLALAQLRQEVSRARRAQ
jgi:hypothetical protein